MASTPAPSTTESILIIHNGGYSALLASLIAESEADSSETAGRGRAQIYAWIPGVGSGLFSDEPPYVGGSISARNRAEMVARQAKLFGFREVFAEEPAARRSRLSVALHLLRAMEIAAEHRCKRVVWPICVGGDLEALRTVTEQASLVSELATLENSLQDTGEWEAMRLSTPFADLEPHDLDRLAQDLDAPLEACWKPVDRYSGPSAGLPKTELIGD